MGVFSLAPPAVVVIVVAPGIVLTIVYPFLRPDVIIKPVGFAGKVPRQV
jgi:hypothetical protein